MGHNPGRAEQWGISDSQKAAKRRKNTVRGASRG